MIRTVPIRHLADVRVSNVDKKSSDGERAIRLCNYTDVYYNDAITDAPGFMEATASSTQIARFRLAVGDTVITKDSESSDDIAVPAYVAESADDLVCGYHLAILRPRLERVEPRYLFWAIRSDFCKDQFAVEATGVTRFGLKYESILGVDIPVHQLDEQRRIVDFLDDQVARIEAVIRLRREQIELLNRRRVEFARRITTIGNSTESAHTNIEWMPVIAQGWKLEKISSLFRTGSGTTPSSDNPLYYNGDVPWVNTGDIKDAVIRATRKSVTSQALRVHSALKIYEPGALVIAMYGQGATKGRVGLLGLPACVNQACCVLTPRGAISPEWAFYWFQAHKEQVVQLAVGAGQPNLNQDILRLLRIPVPAPAEQTRLLVALKQHHETVERVGTEMAMQIALLQERKRSLITAAVTGEFDVTTASGWGV
jgi:type I restriction enzyme S subunit